MKTLILSTILFLPFLVWAVEPHCAVFIRMDAYKYGNDHFVIEIIYVKNANANSIHDKKFSSHDELNKILGGEFTSTITSLGEFKYPVYVKRTVLIAAKGTFLAAFSDKAISKPLEIANYDFCITGNLSDGNEKGLFLLKYYFSDQHEECITVRGEKINACRNYNLSGEKSLKLGTPYLLGVINRDQSCNLGPDARK